ncbi:glycosyltransferase [Rhodovulum tesquicola]|uniref:Glycosyltransferase involved in cell wall biosynthesis n=1 Tax=Rhodovulum steppense TaxID=540251 RepID=A0A4R1YWG8_9RHOB|nr:MULTISPECIES: glycosyltransferase [Rhodovulum]MCO8146829.1 glycosyltransferase [Rhodovulum tesquicola]TCM85520.1 glycosyltransferase involved in cell wall biosynthesis [Rhodovulum steppense]
MRLISRVIPNDDTALPPSAEILVLAENLAARGLTPQDARAALDLLTPHLESARPHEGFIIAYAALVENLRAREGMLEFWADVQRLFPQAVTPIRLLMRWYRRQRETKAGLTLLHDLCRESDRDPQAACAMLLGLDELRLYAEMDDFMRQAMDGPVANDELKVRYARILQKRNLPHEALRVLTALDNAERARNSVRALLGEIHRQRRGAIAARETETDDVVRRIVELAVRDLRPVRQTDGIEGVVFYTGQLGPGGAERQMTRIAIALHERQRAGLAVGAHALRGPVRVCVRHTDQDGNGGFFLPVLWAAGVETTILNESAQGYSDGLDTVSDGMGRLLQMLRPDLRETTLRLLAYFRTTRPEVVYLWQDGGVLAAAFAALIAGTPRIVASFRGLPPNRRPERLRSEMPTLYKALAELPHVALSANSAVAARDYEDWLGFAHGTIRVIPNAVESITPDGEADDHALWSGIEARSPGCTATVLGVFRFDLNKRPRLWIEAAAAHARQRPDMRFVLLGDGVEWEPCADLIADLGMQDRIFLTGIRRNVGFYLARADLLMHLARTEGLPNVVIEAQSCGVPVLATPAGGTGEIVLDGETGILLPSAETVHAADVAAMLDALLADRARLRAMGRMGAERAASRFRLDNVLHQTVELFNSHRSL